MFKLLRVLFRTPQDVHEGSAPQTAQRSTQASRSSTPSFQSLALVAVAVILGYEISVSVPLWVPVTTFAAGIAIERTVAGRASPRTYELAALGACAACVVLLLAHDTIAARAPEVSEAVGALLLPWIAGELAVLHRKARASQGEAAAPNLTAPATSGESETPPRQNQ